MPYGFVSAFLAIVLSAFTSSASANLLIKVDKSAQTLTVIRDGQTLGTWPVSTGNTGHPTPSGNFTAFRMEADHFSKEWDDAPMPHSVFFTKQGHAIHGSFDVKRLGSPVSHGCVRLAPTNAAALFALVQQEGLPNTRVVLTGSEQVALQRLHAQRSAQRGAGGARPAESQEASSGIYPDGVSRAPGPTTLSPPSFVDAYPQDDNLQRGYGSPRYVQPPQGDIVRLRAGLQQADLHAAATRRDAARPAGHTERAV